MKSFASIKLSVDAPAAAPRSNELCGTPAGAGKIQIFPSVITPSTSKRNSLIFFARAFDIGRY